MNLAEHVIVVPLSHPNFIHFGGTRRLRTEKKVDKIVGPNHNWDMKYNRAERCREIVGPINFLNCYASLLLEEFET